MSDSKTQTTEERATPGEISRGRTAVQALKMLAQIARDCGAAQLPNESNQEFIGRVLRQYQ